MKRIGWLSRLLLAGSALAPLHPHAQTVCGSGSGASIGISNLTQGEVVGYELLLIKGSMAQSAEKISLDLDGGIAAGYPPPYLNDPLWLPRHVRDWPAGGGRFKAMVHLVPGPNRIMLSAPGHRTRCLDITYSPSPSPNRLRMTFVLAKDTPLDPNVFRAAPGDSSGIISAKRRLAFGALLIETAMAELMYQAGYPRRTVAFKRDARGQAEVTVYHSKRSDAELRAKTPDELYDVFRGELDTALQDGRTKFVCMLGGFGSGALGGSSQAMFGTTTLYSWAQGLDEILQRFTDERKPREFQLEDESAFRGTFWSNYSTGIGATLHELGHALGLPNLDEEDDVMQRGFDRFNRIFMLHEDGGLISDQAVHYGATSSELLWKSPWVLAPSTSARLATAGSAGGARLARVGRSVSLVLPAGTDVAVDLYSAQGRGLAKLSVGRLGAGEHRIALPELDAGSYVCVARLGNGRVLRTPVLVP